MKLSTLLTRKIRRSVLPAMLCAALLAPQGTQAAEMTNQYAPYHGHLIYEEVMGENLCALTFDDGPSNFTPQLLDMLDEYGIRATFFVLGRNVAKLPDVVRRAAEEGHEIASHSYSHPNFLHLGPNRRKDELVRTNSLLRACGVEPTLFRPPYGAKDKNLARLANDLGMRIVTWSHDTEDWKRLPKDYARLPDPRGHIAARGRLRGIFLFHDIHKATVDDIPRVIQQLRAGGCQRFVTVSDYMTGFYNDHEPAMHMTKHRRETNTPSQRGRAFTGSAQAEVDVMRLAAAVLAEEGETPVWGVPALGAWQGYPRDELTVRPFPKRHVQLATTGPAEAPEKEVRAHSGRSGMFFMPNEISPRPEPGSKSYVVRELSPKTAHRDQ